MGTIMEASWFMPAVAGGVGLIVLIVFLLAIYRVADPNRALVVTGLGCKEPKVKVSGGTFVIPIFQKAKFFPLDIMTIVEAGDEVRTNKAVPIIIKWTAQASVRTPDSYRGTNLEEGAASLVKTIRLFIDKGSDGMKESVKNTIQANVRETIASMTPEAVLTNKKEFVDNIMTATRPDLLKLGIELSTLNINDVCDQIGYYDNMSAAQIEEKRREAEIARAEADKDIREKQADANRSAREKELAAELTIAERTRNNDVKKAEFKVETETADANADIARSIQTQIRQVELNEQTGVALAKERELENSVAKRQNEISETEALRAVIDAKGKAEALAAQKKIEADAQAQVMKIEADGIADAEKRKAQGSADAVRLEAEAEKDRITQVGKAEAEVISAKGLAEADAIKAQGLAKAEAERALAEALAAEESVNFRVEQLKINANMQVEIATNVATVMANLGTNAKFINIGGGTNGGTGKTGNVLLDTLAGIPETVFRGNVRSDAMNDSSLGGDLGSIIDAVLGRKSGEGGSPLDNIVKAFTSSEEPVEVVSDEIVVEEQLPVVEESVEASKSESEIDTEQEDGVK
jgi:flotillin